ncbi:beta-1,3-glucanase family protein [Eubacterium ventriosum]|uniref:beta-1,3-glucanase family protein n=1 Tax=Eubacterium ventriosum TaxID=39496 RepID=UPI00399AD6E5
MNKMKRILTVVLTLALLITMMPSNLTGVNAKTVTKLSSKKIVLQVGKTKKLKVKNKPAGVKVTWKSSKKKVATVSKKGKVKAKKAGKTTITAKVGKKKYKCRVIVRNKTNNVSQNVTKPANDNQNVTNKVTVTKPEGTTVRPITTTKPEGTTVRPITTTKPEGTTVRPTTTTKPEGTTVRPTTTTKPEGTTVRPTTTTKPEGTTVRPTTTTKPEGTTVRPTTTTKPEGTTVRPTTTTKPEETTVRPTEPDVDNDIQAPVGLVHAPGEGLPYHFAWAAVDGADGYNVYIDGVYVTKVTENVADLDASMFTKGAVEYTVGIATVKGDKISAITSVKYTYDGNGAQATTNVSVATTVASVTTPSVPGQDVDESIKAPEGLVWAGNTDLPYYFAWAKADGIDSYNVYVDGTLVANVVDGSVNLNESVFTKGSGEYAIGIAAVKGNKTSAITSIKYTYAGSGQPATTKAPETSTAKPTDVTVAPTAPGQDIDESIQAPVGLVWAGNADLPYYFAWAPVVDVDSYNVYVDGVYATNVGASSVNLDKAVFTKGSGEYTIGVASVKNNKISSITSIKYTYAESGQPATTKAPEPSTAKPTDVTVAPTAPGQDIDESIQAPVGLVWAGNADLPYYFAWAPVVDVDSYNVYVDGVYATNVGASSVNLDKAVFTKGSGEYTIGVASVKNNKISSITSIKYTYAESGQPATTKAPEVPTVAPTTVKPTTAKPTTKPKETTTIAFTTDSSIEKPFGLDVSQASVGYVNIVWGRGTIDCYNVYVDGERRRTGISAQSLKLPVYTEGTHTIAITTVVGTRESEKLEVQVAITGTGEKETEPETCPEELKPQLKKNVPLRDDRIAIELNNKTNGKYSDSEIYWCILGNNENNQLCYMDKDGNMIPASESLNTVEVNGTKYANIYHTLAESDHVYAPTIRSGRMYLSYGKPVYVKFNGSTGYAGPDLNNPGDVNANTLFEFAEFTIEGKNYWGNTTRVDYFCFPMVTRLIGGSLYGGYDNVVGDIGTRDEIFTAFKNEVPNEYKSLVRDDRIIAPCKSTFNVGQDNGNYFDNYINEFWNKYANEDLRFSSESGSFVGRVVGNQMRFTREGDSTVYYVDKPNTQEVLEGKGAFDRGNGVEKAIEAQLCAAFNRGVATEPDKWYTPSQYYKNSVANFYAGFFHEHSVLGKAYGFCYDDVNDQSTLLQYNKADALVIDLKW